MFRPHEQRRCDTSGVIDPLARLGHLNLLEFGRESTRWGDGRLEERDGVLLFATGSTLPVLVNGAFRLHDDVPAADVVAQADAFFRTLGRGYSVMVRDSGEDDDLGSACQAAGLTVFGAGGPQMVCRARLNDVAPSDGVEVRTVASATDVHDFVGVNAQAYATYGMPPEVASDVVGRADRFLGAPNVVSVVAYLDGAPVAAAQTLLSHGIAGVYWVGTVDSARGRGLGEAVTRAVTNAAFDLGATANSLQASPMGEPIYRRMGYEEIYRYATYTRLTPPE
jgi:GNAT superfamily N-acetyltransferase